MFVFLFFQRDGCPKIVNLGSSKTDLFYERKKYGFKKRWVFLIWYYKEGEVYCVIVAFRPRLEKERENI